LLVIQRKKLESFLIGENILVKVVRIKGDRVSIAIEAPKDMPIRRSEILLGRLEHGETADSDTHAMGDSPRPGGDSGD
jgi:carbon storage regulator